MRFVTMATICHPQTLSLGFSFGVWWPRSVAFAAADWKHKVRPACLSRVSLQLHHSWRSTWARGKVMHERALGGNSKLGRLRSTSRCRGFAFQKNSNFWQLPSIFVLFYSSFFFDECFDLNVTLIWYFHRWWGSISDECFSCWDLSVLQGRLIVQHWNTCNTDRTFV